MDYEHLQTAKSRNMSKTLNKQLLNLWAEIFYEIEMMEPSFCS